MTLTFVVRYDIIPCCGRVEISAIALRVPYTQKLTSGLDVAFSVSLCEDLILAGAMRQQL
jgi:hypothetical protein